MGKGIYIPSLWAKTFCVENSTQDSYELPIGVGLLQSHPHSFESTAKIQVSKISTKNAWIA